MIMAYADSSVGAKASPAPAEGIPHPKRFALGIGLLIAASCSIGLWRMVAAGIRFLFM
jgi:hypothetical protein